MSDPLLNQIYLLKQRLTDDLQQDQIFLKARQEAHLIPEKTVSVTFGLLSLIPDDSNEWLQNQASC